MKKAHLLFLVLSAFILSGRTYSQEYFVARAGKYVSSSNFNTNIQQDISKYEGRYNATSETYESGLTFEITTQGNVLNIVLIYGATMGVEDNWEQDTSVYKNVDVKDGKFTLDLIVNLNPDVNGVNNFRFVKCTYKPEGENKTIKAEGIACEDWNIFAEKEK